MKKILFINPPNVPFTVKELLIEPIDILTVASFIQSIGYEVKVLDMDVKRLNPESIEEFLMKFTPDYIVITLDYHIPMHTHKAIDGILKMITIIKKYDCKVIIGGKTSKYYPKIFLENGAQIIVNGELELTLKEIFEINSWTIDSLLLVRGITFSDNKLMKVTSSRNEVISLDNIPIIDRGLIDIDDYIDVRTILTSRGCNGKCSFCPTPDFWGKWRYMNPKKVVDQIENLVNHYNTKKILFLDDNATISKTRMQEICNEINIRGIKVHLGCLGTISSFDEDTMKIMHNAGFVWIHFGIETGNQDILNSVGKDFDVNHAMEVIKKSMEIGYRVRTSFILDLPGSTEKTINDTKEFIINTKPNEIRIHYLSLRCGTQIFNKLKTDDMVSQYIHSNTPQVSINKKLNKALSTCIENISITLKNSGYSILNESSQFGQLTRSKNKNFISFCPSKYGIGWEE